DLAVQGMTCASCAAKIEKKLNGIDGVSATVNYATDKATVTYDPGSVEPDALVDAVQGLGYQAQLPVAPVAPPPVPAHAGAEHAEHEHAGHAGSGAAHEHDHTEPLEQARHRLLVSAVLAIPVIAMSMIPALQFE